MNETQMKMKRGPVAAALAAAFVAALALSCLSCENALAAEAAALQAKAVSPVISVKLADSSALKSGGSLAFGAISVGASSDIVLTIKNAGVETLSIDIAGIKVTPDSSTAASVFAVSGAPDATIASSGTSSIVIRFTPDAEGAKGATVSIPTNDVSTPSFSFSLSGKGWAVALSTTAVSSISYVGAASGGNITNDGGEAIIERGICWSASQNPTTSDHKQADGGAGIGSYSCALSGLLPGTYYYVRAYARTSLTTGYGPSVGFTSSDPSLPTCSASAITATGANAGCVATAAYTGITLDEYGLCWDTSAAPTVLGTHAVGASVSLTGLSSATIYYLRPYMRITNGTESGVFYGGQLPIKTAGYKSSLSGYYVVYDAGSVQTDSGGNWRYIEAGDFLVNNLKYRWNSNLVKTNVVDTAIGKGYDNTKSLSTLVAAGSAANLIYGASINSHSDWFIPSRDELALMYTTLIVPNPALYTPAPAGPWIALSSSEYDADYRYVWTIDLTYRTSMLSHASCTQATYAWIWLARHSLAVE